MPPTQHPSMWSGWCVGRSLAHVAERTQLARYHDCSVIDHLTSMGIFDPKHGLLQTSSFAAKLVFIPHLLSSGLISCSSCFVLPVRDTRAFFQACLRHCALMRSISSCTSLDFMHALPPHPVVLTTILDQSRHRQPSVTFWAACLLLVLHPCLP